MRTAYMVFISSVQSLSRVWLFVTPWTAAHQASLSITNSRSLLNLMSVVSVMPSSYLILCHPLVLLPSIFPSIRVFSNESVLRIRWPSIGVSASASVLPVNIQDWIHIIALLYCAHLCMQCSLGIFNFLEEISSLSHSVVFLYFFALIIEEGFLISPCYSLELHIQMVISFLFSFASSFSSFLSYL